MQEKILNSINKLDRWTEQNGWSGYDPYDIKSLTWVLKLTKWGNHYKFFEIWREIIFELFYTWPEFMRKILRVKTQMIPKAMALFSKAYLDLYQQTGKNKSETVTGVGWGYPFDWQTHQLIPKFTPNGIVTTAAGDAFWSWYKHSGEQKYLDICVQICIFLETLPIDRISDSQICFSYTPLYKDHVHNLNLFIAEFLTKVGLEIQNQQWIDFGTLATNYTISNQRTDGAFDYNGPPETPKQFVDNYHSGFVLRMLHSLWQMTEKKDIFDCLKKCYEHYMKSFFKDNKIPKLLPERTYRIDIHSCAESINCLSQLAHSFPEGLKIAENVANWTIENLQDEEGYFYYGVLKSRFTGRLFIPKIPYIRWGQAWMLKSLSNLLKEVS